MALNAVLCLRVSRPLPGNSMTGMALVNPGLALISAVLAKYSEACRLSSSMLCDNSVCEQDQHDIRTGSLGSGSGLRALTLISAVLAPGGGIRPSGSGVSESTRPMLVSHCAPKASSMVSPPDSSCARTKQGRQGQGQCQSQGQDHN